MDRDPQAPAVCSDSFNASDRGLALRVHEVLDIDETLAMEIHANPSRPPVQAVARVAWCRSEGDAYLAGVEFVWIGCPSLGGTASMMPALMWPFR